MGRSDFDPHGCRLLDSIWPVGTDESQAVTQSLRCYSLADLRLLLEGTGLALQTIEPYESEDHDKRVSLKQALLYLAKLAPEVVDSGNQDRMTGRMYRARWAQSFELR